MADATGAADSVSFELKASTDANSIANTTLLTTTDVETINLKVSSDETISLANLGAITDASLYSSLVVTGDKALTISATNADLTGIDASGMSTGGSVVQTGRSSTVAADYVGSTGNDTFIMTLGTDVMDGGEKTGDNDTLDVNFTGVLGAISIDLSSATDQITTFNGLTEATVQKGFESVDLAGYANFGSQVIGSDEANTVTGTASADTISLGKGADVYTVTAGNDQVDLGAGDDTVTFTGTLLAGHSGTTSNIDGGTGDDTVNTSTATLVDADFRGITNMEVLDFTAGDSTLTYGDAAEATGITKIDTSGTAAVFITQDTGDNIGLSDSYLQISGYTVNDASMGFDFLGTDAASDADLSASGFAAVPVAGLFVDADGTAASFFTAAAAGFAAGDVGIFVTGGNTYAFAEGAATTAGDDVYLELLGVELTSVSATHGLLVLHIT